MAKHIEDSNKEGADQAHRTPLGLLAIIEVQAKDLT